MADREILTLKRKPDTPVATTVIEKPTIVELKTIATKKPKPPTTVELIATQATKKTRPEVDTINELVTAYPQTFFIQPKLRKPLMIGNSLLY
jgi:hypothetical protein